MNWPLVELGAVAEWGSGGTPNRAVSEFFGNGVPWVSIADLNDGIVSVARESLTQIGIANSAARVVPPGTVLVAMYGSIGKLGIAGSEMCTSQAIAFAKPNERVLDRRYLFQFLLAERPKLMHAGRGGTQSNISQGALKSWKMALPPLPEQRRIAAILDHAETLMSARRRVIESLDGLKQSTFHAMFQSQEPGEAVATLGEVAQIQSGITKGRRTALPTRSVPYLAVSNVKAHRLELAKVKEIEATESEVEKYRLEVGDLLLTEGGDPDKLGRGTIWNGEIEDAIHQNHIFRVRILDRAIKPVYLSWLLGARESREHFLRSAKQTTGIASINKTQLSKTPIRIADVERQEQFESAISSIELLKDRAMASSNAMLLLFATLQGRAFNGGP